MPLLSCTVGCLQGDAPVVWRGPIVNSAIDKFLMGTAWGRLDILVVDMPPGELLVES
jgi:ATP-binding protein involved in chromosome partitioning